MIFRILFYTFALSSLQLWASTNHENASSPSVTRPPAIFNSDSTSTTEAQGTSSAETAQSTPDAAPTLTEGNAAWRNLNPDEKKVAAKMLAFWSLGNKENLAPEVLANSGLTDRSFSDLKKVASTAGLPSKKEEKILRSDFKDEQIAARIYSRAKIVHLVDKLQASEPEFRDFLPEMLTVWGESRGIKGFSAGDDILQQAKMASIIHVLRNRTLKRLEFLRRKGIKFSAHAEKWKVATARFQFSAFEPYDPNLAELALGPNTPGRAWSFDSLPKNDQRALVNLAQVIVKLNSGLIQIADPLGQSDTRHYLTPQLVKYDRREEKSLQKTWKASRFHVLKIPTLTPQFLAVVPDWAQQKQLIADPSVKLQGEGFRPSQEVKIPSEDFVYFGGVL